MRKIVLVFSLLMAVSKIHAVDLALSTPSSVSAANLCPGSVNRIIYKFQIASNSNNPSVIPQLSQLNFNTTGSAVNSDLVNFKLWVDSTSTVFSASGLLSTVSASLGAGTHSFTGMTLRFGPSKTFSFWITADIALAAVNNNTLTVTPITVASFTISPSGGLTGSANAAGQQTISTVTASITETDNSGIANDNIICSGGSATLTASPAGNNYLWSNGQTTQAITVSPSSNSTFTVTVTNGSSCTSQASKLITVNPPFTSTITETDNSGITNDNTICAGGSANLSANPSGNNYLWSNGQTSQSITVNPSGNTTFTVTITSSSGCTSQVSQLITVSPVFSASITEADNSGTANDNIICAGGSATLTANPSGGSYLWSGGQTTQTITVNPSSTATFTVTVTNGAGCTSNANSTITVTAGFSAGITETDNSGTTNDNTLCPGGSATLTASPSGNNYLWSNGQTTQAITVSPSSTTTFTVTVTNGSGCNSQDSQLITVSPVLTASITENDNSGTANDNIICSGGSATLTANPSGNSYLWSTGQTTQTITVSPSTTATFTVTVTNTSGCTSQDSQLITVSAVLTASITETDNSGTANDNIICSGASAALTANPSGNSYLWSTGQTTQTITVNPSSNTTFTVTVTNGSGCTSQDSQLITIKSLPNPRIDGDSIICNATLAPVLVTDVAQHTITTFSWSNGATTSSTNITLTPGNSTSFTVTITDSNGCRDSVSESFHSIKKPVATAINDFVKCPGEVFSLLNLTGTNLENEIFKWTSIDDNIGQNPDSGTTSIPQFIVVNNGTNILSRNYTVTPINFFPSTIPHTSCPGNVENFKVTVNPKPELQSSIDTVICSGQQVGYQIKTSLDPNAITSWSHTSVNGIAGATNDTAFVINDILVNDSTIQLNQLYTLTLSFTNAGKTCSTQKPYKVTVSPLPQPPIITSLFGVNDSICGGSNNINFSTINTNLNFNNIIYTWSSSNSSAVVRNDAAQNTIISFNDSTVDYTAQIIATANLPVQLGGCKSSDTTDINIDAVQTTVSDDIIVPKQPGNLLFYLDNTVSGYRWGFDIDSTRFSSFIDGQYFQVFVPDPQFISNNQLDTVTFDFWVLVDKGGCQSRIYYDGKFAKPRISQPNNIPDEITSTITPNPNNGNFEFNLSGKIYGKIDLRILNSMGQLVSFIQQEKTLPSQNFTLRLPRLNKGMYFIKVTDVYGERLVSKLLIR